MKLSNALIALCAFHPSMWGTTAFVGPAHNQVAFKQGSKLWSTYLDSVGDVGTMRAPGPDSIPSSVPQAPITPYKSNSPLPADEEDIQSIWETSTPVIVQGNSLRTWSFKSEAFERVQVLMRTGGRPLNANVDLWQGPDNTPQTMAVYIEDGSLRPFSAVIETPRESNTVAIRNTGNMEFPLEACVEAESAGPGSGDLASVTRALEDAPPRIVQGGAVYTVPFAPDVASVQILLKTDGRPLNSRIELLQGPNNNKQILEFYSENGDQRPFFAVIETPGAGNVVRIVNTAPMEFPLTARVEPYLMEEFSGEIGPNDWTVL